MKRKTLFIITTVMIMSLAGCGTSKEVPALSESVETETVMEDTPTDEVTDNIQEETTETGQQTSQSSEVIEESTLTEEKVQLEEELNEETSALEEVKEITENDPDAPDPSLTQEQLDKLDALFDDIGEGSGYTMGGKSDDPNTPGGLKYYGDDHVRDWN